MGSLWALEVRVHLCGPCDLLVCMGYKWFVVVREEIMAKTIEGMQGEAIELAVTGDDGNIMIRTRSGKMLIIDGQNLMYKVTQGAVPKDKTFEELKDQLMVDWEQAYAAFVGAFDTPIQRRKMADEYSADARARLRDFSEKLSLIVEAQKEELRPLAEKIKKELSKVFNHYDIDIK